MSLVWRTPFYTQAQVRKKPHCRGSMMTGVKQLSNREFHGSISQMRMTPCLNSRPISKEGTPWSTKNKQTVGVVLADTLFTQVTPRFIMCGSVVKVHRNLDADNIWMTDRGRLEEAAEQCQLGKV
jgi:hypothetical protein